MMPDRPMETTQTHFSPIPKSTSRTKLLAAY